MSVSIELNPKARREIEEILDRTESEHAAYLKPNNYKVDDSARYKVGAYPYKPTLDIFITDQYTADGAWAHTEPDRRVICIRPWERLDYDILLQHLLASVPMDLPFGPYALHEVAHNAHREASEGAIRRLTIDPNTRYVVNEFNLKYHGRN